MCSGRLHPNSANTLKPFCVSKRYTSNPGAIATWIYSYNKSSPVIITVEFVVKFPHYLNSLRIVCKGIHHLKTRRHISIVNKISVEINNSIGKCLHNTKGSDNINSLDK